MGYQGRRERRQIQVNSRRSALGEVMDTQSGVITALEVKTLAERLKHKGHFTVQDFVLLNHAIIQNEENIIAFFRVTGALHALVRELTGQNASLQLGAVNCCCNLALGNEKSCLQLTKAAAPYLISHLDGLNNHLLEICVLTLGNLAGSHKSWAVLQAQGLLPKLIHLLTSSSNNVVCATLYALTHYVKIGLQTSSLNLALLRTIAMNVHPIMEREQSACWVIYLLSCCTECDDVLLSNLVVSRVVHLLGECKIGLDGDMNVLKTTALVRILGNLSVRRDAAELMLTDSSVVSVLRILLTYPYLHIQRETLWLIGNLLNHPSVEIECLAKISNFEDSLEPLLSDAISKLL